MEQLPIETQNATYSDITWYNPRKLNDQLGLFFAVLPKEHIIQYFCIESDPNIKNNLRRTNKAFSVLRSWNNRQPFMFCKELCASECDIKSIIIQKFYQNRDICNNTITPYEQDILKVMVNKLKASYCPIVIDTDNKTIELVKIIERILHICIQNDDEKSLELIVGKERNNVNLITFDVASKLIQWAVFCASDKAIRVIGYHYKKLCYDAWVENHCTILPKEINYIQTWLNVSPKEEEKYLSSIVMFHLRQLGERNTNRLPQLYNCVKYAVNLVDKLLDLIDKDKKNKNEKCIIS